MPSTAFRDREGGQSGTDASVAENVEVLLDCPSSVASLDGGTILGETDELCTLHAEQSRAASYY